MADPIFTQESLDQHVLDHTRWGEMLTPHFNAWVREMFGPRHAYAERLEEFTVQDIGYRTICFEAYMHGQDVWLEMPTLYAFDPDEWRSQEAERKRIEAEQKAAKEALDAAKNLESRRRQYENLKREFEGE